MDEKSTWCANNVSFLPDFASNPPGRGGLNTKLGDHDSSKSQNP